MRMSHLSSISIPYCNPNNAIILPHASSFIHRNSDNSINAALRFSSTPKRHRFPCTVSRSHPPPSNPLQEGENDPDAQVQTLRVPDQWLHPATALQESEWLRVTLHKWLDEEYCPEETNVAISKIAALSYYKSLVEKRADVGEILLSMARDLETISYQESFHGAFSSANAAVNLIAQRIQLQGK